MVDEKKSKILYTWGQIASFMKRYKFAADTFESARSIRKDDENILARLIHCYTEFDTVNSENIKYRV